MCQIRPNGKNKSQKIQFKFQDLRLIGQVEVLDQGSQDHDKN